MVAFLSVPVQGSHLSPKAFIPKVAFMHSIHFAMLRIKCNKYGDKTKVQETHTLISYSSVILDRLNKIIDPQLPPRTAQLKYCI